VIVNCKALCCLLKCSNNSSRVIIFLSCVNNLYSGFVCSL
jgi:hypothetical protein